MTKAGAETVSKKRVGAGREGEGEKPNFKRKQALRQVEESLGT